MIFKQWQQVLDGTKGQTRRPDFPYELARQLWKHGWSYPRNIIPAIPSWRIPARRIPWGDWLPKHPISDAHIVEANRILAENVITLPAQPGRGKKAVGRIRITKIRRERLQEISRRDCEAEGVSSVDWEWGTFWQTEEGPERVSPQEAYEDLWESIYRQPQHRYMGYRWRDNPEVWVLDFERSER